MRRSKDNGFHIFWNGPANAIAPISGNAIGLMASRGSPRVRLCSILVYLKGAPRVPHVSIDNLCRATTLLFGAINFTF